MVETGYTPRRIRSQKILPLKASLKLSKIQTREIHIQSEFAEEMFHSRREMLVPLTTAVKSSLPGPHAPGPHAYPH